MRTVGGFLASEIGCFGGGFFLAMVVFCVRLGGVLSESSLEVEGEGCLIYLARGQFLFEASFEVLVDAVRGVDVLSSDLIA